MFHVTPSVKPNSIPTGKQPISVETRQGQSWWAAAPRPRLCLPAAHRELGAPGGTWQAPPAQGQAAPERPPALVRAPHVSMVSITTQSSNKKPHQVSHLPMLLHNRDELNQKH